MVKRILLVNKFYYNRGGDCVATLNLETLLKEHGHDVAIISMNYPQNFPSDYSDYFLPEVNFSGSLSDKLNAAKRILGFGIKNRLCRILDDFRPDLVHLQNIHSQISPLIAKLAHERNIPVVWTLHDYKLICPAYSCLREGIPCELCFTDKTNVIRHRCMKGGIAGSIIGYAEALKWNKSLLSEWTDAFICPSEFMASKMRQNNFPNINVLSNFADPKKISCLNSMPETNRRDYICYVGRLSKEKGVPTLLKAATLTGLPIRLVGGGPLENELKEKFEGYSNITFCGAADSDGVCEALSKAKFSVIPSECYENNPLACIESLCAGTPVVGTKIGGIPELINSETGIIVEPKDVEGLAKKLSEAYSRDWDYSAIRRESQSRFSAENYYRKLIGIYSNIIKP